MATLQADILRRHLRTLTNLGSFIDQTDQELLERFTTAQEEEAFATLVRRYGGLVWSVCQRVLHNAHDAEDAFQAAFLILARKAASIRKRESLSSWLHGVAYRIAVRVKTRTVKRQQHEKQSLPRPSPDPLAEVTGRELLTVLDEELQQLPEPCRAPLLLCYFQGKTRDEAALLLGWSLGTFKRRLEDAKQRLARRLLRRGLTLAVALSALAAVQSATAGGVPSLLNSCTHKGK
jgi:RNA polymerase sigma factor (sigma-70 family)